MLAACASTLTTTHRPARRSRIQVTAPPEAPQPSRFTRNELVDLLRDYKVDPNLTLEQRREAIAWIVSHQHGGA